MKFIKFSKVIIFIIFLFIFCSFSFVSLLFLKVNISNSFSSVSNNISYYLTKPINFSNEILNDLKNLINSYENNKSYKFQVYNTSSLYTTIKSVEDENKELKRLINLKDNLSNSTNVNFSLARVYQRVPNSWNSELFVTIDSSNIVNKGAVLSNGLLVGILEDLVGNKGRVNFFMNHLICLHLLK